MLWAAKRANCLNFVPVDNPEERQKLVHVAIGDALPMNYYTSLRDTNPAEPEKTMSVTTTTIGVPNTLETQDCEITTSQDSASENTIHDNAAELAVTEACNLICAKLESSQDKNLAKGMLQFAKRVKRLASSMHGNLTSALFNFGANELRKGKNGKKIKVQPNRKRKHANGSHQVVRKGRPVTFSAMEIPSKKAKRQHSFAKSVRQNVNIARKSGSHVMRSKTK
jgi:hypothetical protein